MADSGRDPEGGPAARPATPKPDADVVDPAVLAERRARRAELAEAAVSRRADEAERTVALLHERLGQLQQQAEQATGEHETARAGLAARDRALREAVQRAHAEQRRREEAVEEAAATVRRAEAEAAALAERLAEAEGTEARLGAQLSRMRRELAEANQAHQSGTAGRRRAEHEAGEAAERMDRVSRAVRSAEEGVTQARAAIEASRRHQLELRSACEAAQERAREEAARRAHAEHEVEQQREAAQHTRDAVEGLERQAEALSRRATEAEAAAAGDRELLRDLLATTAGALVRAEAQIVQALETAGETERRHVRERAQADRQAQEQVERRQATEAALCAAVGGRDRARAALAKVVQEAALLRTRLSAPDRADGRLAQAQSARAALEARASSMASRLGEEAALRERLEGELALATRERARAQRRGDAVGAELARLHLALGGPAAGSADRAPGTVPDGWLARGLRIMARDDPAAAAHLLLSLVPAQGLVVARSLDFDLDLAQAGVYAVLLDNGRGHLRELAAPRPRREVDFRLRVAAPALAELLIAGGAAAARDRRSVRVAATRRRRRALRLLPPACLDLERLAEAGVWADPALCLRALVYLIDPAWTRGHRFVVAQEIADGAWAPWHVVVDDGAPVTVAHQPPPEPPAAHVRFAGPAAFQRRLAGSAGMAEKAAIRGDARAVDLLGEWVRRAQAGGPAAPAA